jgi:hypothetical protein
MASMTTDLKSFLWREEITEWTTDTPNHIYLTKGTDLYGYVKHGSSEVKMFLNPKKAWSPSRRQFRKLGKKEIDALCTNITVG